MIADLQVHKRFIEYLKRHTAKALWNILKKNNKNSWENHDFFILLSFLLSQMSNFLLNLSKLYFIYKNSTIEIGHIFKKMSDFDSVLLFS